MKLMTGSVFVDTNILVYAHTDLDLYKQAKSQSVISDNNSIVSTQVLQELINTLSRKFKLPWSDISLVISDSIINHNIHINTDKTILEAVAIAKCYGYSFYDSVIISAAIESNCSVLYSEDMQNGHLINDVITIINPFKLI